MNYKKIISAVGWGLILLTISLALLDLANNFTKVTQSEDLNYQFWTRENLYQDPPDFKKEWLVKRIHVVAINGLITEINDSLKESECLDASTPAILTIGGSDSIKAFVKNIYGEELWVYCSPPDNWAHLGGRMGLVLIHNNQVVAQTTLLMN